MTRWLDNASGSGDPGRVHTEGHEARVALEEARARVAELLGTRPRQVVFTSGGTEAINAASWGAARARPGAPIVLAEVEHSAVRESSARLTEIATLPVDSVGRIDPTGLEETIERLASLGKPPALVHCQSANHEVGTTQPVPEIVEVCHRHGVLLHVDACASVGHIPIAADAMGADLVSVSAHKFGGPSGSGALIARRGLRIEAFVVGGDQERARRAGFENTMAIVGFGAAAAALCDDRRLAEEARRSRRLTDRLLAIATRTEGIEVLGDKENRTPNIVCVAVGGVEAEPVLLSLDQAGIAAHSGSSCASESLAPSPVLTAMGADPERSLRLSVGWSSTDDDIDAFEAAFGPAVAKLRALRS